MKAADAARAPWPSLSSVIPVIRRRRASSTEHGGRSRRRRAPAGRDCARRVRRAGGRRLALVELLVDPEQSWRAAAADSMAEFKDPASADAILPLVTHAHAFVRMGALRALKELRCKDR